MDQEAHGPGTGNDGPAPAEFLDQGIEKDAVAVVYAPPDHLDGKGNDDDQISVEKPGIAIRQRILLGALGYGPDSTRPRAE
jgi:hypothetical protein